MHALEDASEPSFSRDSQSPSVHISKCLSGGCKRCIVAVWEPTRQKLGMMSCYRGGGGDGAGCQGVLAATFPQLVLWRYSWTACTWRARGQKNIVAVVSSSVHGGRQRICIPPKLDKFPAFARGMLTLWTAAESYLLALGVSLCSLALDGVQRAPWVAFLSLFPSVSTAVIKKDGLRRTRYAHDLWLCFHYIRCRGHREMNKAVYFFNEYWMGECELAEASSRKKSGAVRDDIRTRGSRGRWITFFLAGIHSPISWDWSWYFTSIAY